MQSLIVTGKDIDRLREKANEIILENKVSKFDIETLSSEKQIGISEIRNLQKKIFLTTVKSEKKAVVLEAFFGITIEAQNSFLKILEEPPLSTIIIILATSLDSFLPTIVSRCNLISLEKTKKLTSEEVEENVKILKELKENKIGAALFFAQENGKTKESALSFLEGLINASNILIGNNDNFSDKEITKMLKDFQKFYTIIKTTNVNVRFALENLLLNLF